MASSRDRQRKLARAKLDRQMARRAAREHRRRRILAGVGSGVAVLLIVAGVAWVGGAFDSADDETTDPAALDVCAWSTQSRESNTSLKDVGTPPTKDIPVAGVQPMTITTNQGEPITASLDSTTAPCGVASLSYLAGKKFFDNTDCHEITTFGALRCGDPTGTGQGGPTYSVFSENVPTAPAPSASPGAGAQAPLYPKGTVAFIGDPPGTNGSQFLLFFKDYSPPSADFAIVGSLTGGMATLEKISKIPTKAEGTDDKVTPTQKITITSLTVGADVPPSAAPSASAQS